VTHQVETPSARLGDRLHHPEKDAASAGDPPTIFAPVWRLEEKGYSVRVGNWD